MSEYINLENLNIKISDENLFGEVQIGEIDKSMELQRKQLVRDSEIPSNSKVEFNKPIEKKEEPVKEEPIKEEPVKEESRKEESDKISDIFSGIELPELKTNKPDALEDFLDDLKSQASLLDMSIVTPPAMFRGIAYVEKFRTRINKFDGDKVDVIFDFIDGTGRKYRNATFYGRERSILDMTKDPGPVIIAGDISLKDRDYLFINITELSKFIHPISKKKFIKEIPNIESEFFKMKASIMEIKDDMLKSFSIKLVESNEKLFLENPYKDRVGTRIGDSIIVFNKVLDFIKIDKNVDCDSMVINLILRLILNFENNPVNQVKLKANLISLITGTQIKDEIKNQIYIYLLESANYTMESLMLQKYIGLVEDLINLNEVRTNLDTGIKTGNMILPK